ncbi:hypothetical protein DLE60_24805 [Micromonospora globispora]|uniref:DUF4190 domain-containing protein n=1 Tax=Micromonospora globispora TaxID=1450148 RepID=UPI000D702F2C|nr:DUF4190 domain-containing protein [Micromonospora globispora]PWU57280.1 hypothetical protein DLE60_24805 [Micromonospora globispora]
MQPGYPGQDPYGQQPPQDPTSPQYQDPYAPPPAAPYGQQPPAGQPYGQPQDPYSQPQPPQYGQQPTSGQPYGQPTSGQPYGQPTSGQPYGQPPPYQDPYAAQQPYGAAPTYPNAGYPQPQGQQNTLGLVSMILGIASIPLICCLYLGIPVGIAAVVTGYLGRQKAAQGLATNDGQAKAGLICGAIGAGLGIVLIILAVVGNFNLPTEP